MKYHTLTVSKQNKKRESHSRGSDFPSRTAGPSRSGESNIPADSKQQVFRRAGLCCRKTTLFANHAEKNRQNYLIQARAVNLPQEQRVFRCAQFVFIFRSSG
ncbi:hypothetical protein CDAR_278391 [Caerostris darwini]|uniref:Uncharacterized protein n=1 Tax=Caerostris darwini TaxID=1538125 RepID=A0AAV4WR28_9ARAC|nr:hypothetical protein CDAR_278391 [Caerostris darwini]